MSQRQEAFREILPTLPAKRAAVHGAISSQGEHGATLSELVGLLAWPINRISGRVTELSRAGMLSEAGIRGRQTIWVACLPQGQTPKPTKRTVQARVENIGEPDLFGRTRILVSVPADSVGALKTMSLIPLRF